MDYKARFYSPYINRFLQPDTIIPDQINPQSWNRLSYVRNNPVNFNDPTGHAECRTEEECEEMGTTPMGGGSGGNGGAGNNDDGPNLDNDVLNWGTDPLDDAWRAQRSEWVWNWLDNRGGFWGPGRPDIKTLITMLLIEEGVSLMNGDSSDNRGVGIKAMVGLMRLLFDDADGVTPTDLSEFTAFFNPERDESGAWNQADRDVYQNGYDDYTWQIASDYVEYYWDSGPVTYNGNTVNKWWDNSENFNYTVAFSVTIPVESVTINGQTIPKVLYFGYP